MADPPNPRPAHNIDKYEELSIDYVPYKALECKFPERFPRISEEDFPISRKLFADIMAQYCAILLHAMTPKSVTAKGKNLVRCVGRELEELFLALDNEEVPHIITHDEPAPTPPSSTETDNKTNQGLKEDILQCVKKELDNHLSAVNTIKEELIAIQREQVKTTYAAVTSATASATAHLTTNNNNIRAISQPITAKTTPRPSPPPSRPAIIVTPTAATNTKEEAVTAFKKAISFRHTNYAPARVQTISKGKLRVEFDSAEQRDDALSRLRTAQGVTAEPARRLSPLIILKGVSCDTPAEELPSILRTQNPEIEPLIKSDTDLCLRFKRSNRNPALYNAVLQASPSVWRRITEMGRVCVDYMRVHAEDFSPFLQCFRCLQFGHTKAKCTATCIACAHCASSQHTIDDCPVKEDKSKSKCTNCVNHNTRFGSTLDTAHRATSPACPRLKSMRDRIGQRVDYGS